MEVEVPNRDESLPTAFRGYAREPVDRLFGKIEESYRALIAERDRLRAKLEDTTQRLSAAAEELAGFAGRKQALADALIEAEGIRRDAERKAAAIVREAESVRLAAQDEADHLLRQARGELGRLVQDLMHRLGPSDTEPGAEPDRRPPVPTRPSEEPHR